MATAVRIEGKQRRALGPIGTIVRLGLGVFVGFAFYQHWSAGMLQWYTPVLGLVVFPAITILVVLAWQRVRRTPINGNGPWGVIINHAIIFGLVALPFTSLAAGLFYSGSALLAVVRDYKGCEVVAVSNMLLQRHDEVRCFMFTPADALDSWLTRNPKEGC